MGKLICFLLGHVLPLSVSGGMVKCQRCGSPQATETSFTYAEGTTWLL